MDVSDGRHFPNEFPAYSASDKFISTDGKLSDENRKAKLNSEFGNLLHRLEDGLTTHTDEADITVYTGVGGISLFYYHLSQVMEDGRKDEYLESAVRYLKIALKNLKGKRATFLCGDAGPLAIGAVVYKQIGKDDKSKDCIKKLESLGKSVCRDESLPDELLFGRVGYIYALLFVRRHLGDDSITTGTILEVFDKVINSGTSLAKYENSPCPLMYEWHDKKYLGAAHGIAGIVYILMMCHSLSAETQQKCETLVRPTLDWLMSLQFQSGNYPSSIGSQSGDKLIHWCHGAPGWIHMFAMAYKIFGDDKYLSVAVQCGEVIWIRGIIKKGYGICHGVAGNAYAFLTLYNLTQDEKYVYRAWKFAEWCFDYGKHNCRTPDRPYSLFEGMAGTVYFLADLFKPSGARIPAFDLT